MNNHLNSFQFAAGAIKPRPSPPLCWQMHLCLTVPVPTLRLWVHCPRASNGLLPPRSNLVGYVRWDARSDRFTSLCQTIFFNSFTGRTLTMSLATPSCVQKL